MYPATKCIICPPSVCPKLKNLFPAGFLQWFYDVLFWFWSNIDLLYWIGLPLFGHYNDLVIKFFKKKQKTKVISEELITYQTSSYPIEPFNIVVYYKYICEKVKWFRIKNYFVILQESNHELLQWSLLREIWDLDPLKVL